MTFFIDRCLGSRDVPGALRAAGAAVEIHADHFAQDEKDEVWIPAVTARGWSILTKDKRIRRRESEVEALRRSGAAAFVLTGKDLTGAEMAQAFVAALPRMLAIVAKYDRPLVATVSRSGVVGVLVGQRRGGRRK